MKILFKFPPHNSECIHSLSLFVIRDFVIIYSMMLPKIISRQSKTLNLMGERQYLTQMQMEHLTYIAAMWL